MSTRIALPQLLPQALLAWYNKNARALPWRKDRDPYRVWVSEIMLQQTGAEVVARYYPRFLEAFPTVQALAGADEHALMKRWEGLGYYARARNMQKAARVIAEKYAGVFPDTYEALRELPGVGDYTAGAVASICFDRPTPAVDGNVIRVVARIAGIGDEITDAVKKSIAEALRAIYPTDRPGDFTQSLMELGAVVCLPNGQPRCALCPAAGLCAALRDGTALSLPVKKRKPEKKREERTVFLLSCGGSLALRHRENSGLLGGLWELPNVSGALDEAGAVRQAEAWGTRPAALIKALRRSHIFTHIRWDMVCYEIACREKTPDFTWVTARELRESYALPTAFSKFLDGEKE
ncbi:A/G-specific DNA-adenine glycosylase [Sporobacter termitidis DSM 10068]|uniref:Adenine DNA glycosylase n=1 Tax=Sporobacter termitidis DSM 10068 TaxID=1123282 RepID=A0A1M5XPP2_9FIRM|nr:A/G-specific adenine glycosylase [Sporobacter termitidis]SHI01817.1 A/G-specific DNA-adenine glycosylase [Sporobacter termitidis DSM 10068]